MKVMLLKDVYKLGRAGDVKKVADGFGRNFLLPKGLAALATPGALKQSDRIRQTAELERARLNKELAAVHSQLDGMRLIFPAKAGETGKLYGSVTNAMIVEAIEAQKGIKLDRSQIDSQPIKTIGVHTIHVRLTVDLVPEITAVVHHEDLPPESAMKLEVEEAETVGTFADLQAELEAEAVELARAQQEAEEVARAEGEPEHSRSRADRSAGAEDGQPDRPAPDDEHEPGTE